MSDIHKEIEFSLEENQLEHTITELKNERLKEIDKRIKISSSIVEHRRKIIESFEDDEDRVMEYFDHESFVMEESFRSIDRKIKEITFLVPNPYFGRIDFREGEDEEEKLYIGRYGVMNEETLEPIVIDWRSPVSSLFYANKLGDSSYESPVGKVDVTMLLKRQFIVKKEKLHGMFDSAIDVKDEILQEVLSKSSSDKLKDIIMTIQEEQDQIIRKDNFGTIVVNGVAGSGKTTIALHRMAYLLYNNRKSLDGKVLILGPNYLFMEYISEVLPTLGETGINQMTFVDFALEYLDYYRDQILPFHEHMEKVLTNDTEFIESNRYKTSGEFIKELDKLIKELDEKAPIEEVKFYDKVVQSKEEIEDLFYKYYKDMPLYRRQRKIKRIIFGKLRDARNERVWEIEKRFKETVASLSEDELRVSLTNLEFTKNIEIRESIRKVIEIKKTLNWLVGEKVEDLYKRYITNGTITVNDLAPMLYLKVRLEGLKSKKEIKYVVIDEAQDYSELQFRVLKEILTPQGMTIVGDVNQKIIDNSKESAMLSLGDIYGYSDVTEFNLNKSYRSTKEIMEYANRFLEGNDIVPLVRNGNEVKQVNVAKNSDVIRTLRESIMDMEDLEMETVAIIVNNLKEGEELHEALKGENLKFFNKEEMIFKGGYVIIPSYLAKGLEFDGVILMNPSKLAPNVAYVMATRALHNLIVIEEEN